MGHEKSNISIVILAAGSSTRMGEPKQLLSWGKSNLIRETILTAQSSSAKEVIVVLGANYNVIEKEIKDLPITIIENKEWKKGLGKSIGYAASHILQLEKNIDGVLFMLADQPFITNSFLDDLMNAFSLKSNQIIATSYKDGKRGVPTIFDKNYLKSLSLLNDDNGAKSILKRNKDKVVVLNSGIENLDIDTKEIYVSLFQRTFGNKPLQF